MITNYERLQALDEAAMAHFLAFFADHEEHCSGGKNDTECEGCPIAFDGCCEYPQLGCDESAEKWLGTNYNRNNRCWPEAWLNPVSPKLGGN